MCEGQCHRSKVKLTMTKNMIFKDFTVYLTCGLEVKGHKDQGHGRRSKVKVTM